MNCPFYGRFHHCTLTAYNPCDMEMQEMEPEVTFCTLANLHGRDKAAQATPVPPRKPPLFEMCPRRKERRA